MRRGGIRSRSPRRYASGCRRRFEHRPRPGPPIGHNGRCFSLAEAFPRMKTPKGLQDLIDEGVIDQVLRPLKSGKEASVYVVRSGEDVRCAKVYKDMAQRSFQARVQYQEGRKVRGSRQARAMSKEIGRAHV